MLFNLFIKKKISLNAKKPWNFYCVKKKKKFYSSEYKFGSLPFNLRLGIFIFFKIFGLGLGIPMAIAYSKGSKLLKFVTLILDKNCIDN